MHRDLRRLVRPEDREQRLHGEAGRTLARIAGRLANEGYAILALPVSGWRLKVETDDAAAGIAAPGAGRLR